MSPEVSAPIASFYKNGTTRSPVCVHTHGDSRAGYVQHDLMVPTQEEIGVRLVTLLDSLQRVSVSQEGHEYSFEMGVIPAMEQSDRVELRAATYRSTISNNIGNAIEVAGMAAVQPDKSIVYVGALGHGTSSVPSERELKYLRKYGTYLIHEGTKIQSLPVITALARAIHNLDLTVTDIGSDSAGALLTTAYGAAYGANKIKTSHQNVRPGIKDIGRANLATSMLITAQTRSKHHEVISPDPFKMTDDLIKWGISHETEHYKSMTHKTHDSIKMLYSNLVGLGRGSKHGDPLIKDNIAFVQANESAKVLFTVCAKDPLAQSHDLESRMKFIGRRIGVKTDAEITSVILDEMAHNPQTHYPLYLRSLSQAILRGTDVRLY